MNLYPQISTWQWCLLNINPKSSLHTIKLESLEEAANFPGNNQCHTQRQASQRMRGHLGWRPHYLFPHSEQHLQQLSCYSRSKWSPGRRVAFLSWIIHLVLCILTFWASFSGRSWSLFLTISNTHITAHCTGATAPATWRPATWRQPETNYSFIGLQTM